MSAIVGRNLRYFREGKRQTQAEAARHLTERAGLAWTRDQVSNLENGNRETISFEELIAIAFAYAVPIARLFDGDDEQLIGINSRILVTLNMAREAFTRPVARLQTRQEEKEWGARVAEWEATHPAPPDEADKAVAEKLGYDISWIIEAAQELWGHTLTEEREKRLGDTSDLPPRTVQAKRGAMTRKLTGEIAPYVERVQFPQEWVLYERRGSTGERIEGKVIAKGSREEKVYAEKPTWFYAGPYEPSTK